MDEIITIGQSMFDELRKTNSYYVDKTEFLYELCAGKTRSQVSLFTRPRRFGKTLLMSMMENFFSITKDSRELFDGLNIMKHPEFCDKYMNKYPVIFVSFKEAFGRNFDKAYGKFTDIIAEACYNISEIVDNEKINPNTIATFRRLESKTATEGEVENSLVTLMSILYSVYKKKVILLIDEYDVPIAKAFDKDEEKYYPDMLELISGVLSSALKDNDYLEFGVVTGCLRIAKQSIFTGVNNFKNFSVIDRKFSSYFGFTENEVVDILEKIGCADKLPLVREWYDGYLFGNNHIYCPWDVINYASELSEYSDAMPQNFWENTSGNEILDKFVRHGDQDILTETFDILLSGGPIAISVASNLTYDMVTSSVDNIWSILLMTGYLTPIEFITDNDSAKVRIPNKEIQNIFRSTIINKFKNTLDRAKQRAMMKALWDKDSDVATETLSSMLNDVISFYDYHENFYHAFLIGVFSCMGYAVKSNKETGEGRADIVIMNDFNKKIIIIETKRTTDEKKLDAMCDEALEQIIQRKYVNGFKEKFDTIICYGVAFYRKSAMVKLLPE